MAMSSKQGMWMMAVGIVFLVGGITLFLSGGRGAAATLIPVGGVLCAAGVRARRKVAESQ